MDSRDSLSYLKRYENNIYLSWSEYYVDVRKLRGELTKITYKKDVLSKKALFNEAVRFDRKLHKRLERANFFLIAQTGELSSKVQVLLTELEKFAGKLVDVEIEELVTKNDAGESLTRIRVFNKDLCDVGKEMDKLVQYIEQNMEAIELLIQKASDVFGRHSPLSDKALGAARGEDEFLLSKLLRFVLMPPAKKDNIFDRYEEKSRYISRISAKIHLATLIKEHHTQALAALSTTTARLMDRTSIAEEFIISKTSPSTTFFPGKCREESSKILIILLYRLSRIRQKRRTLEKTLAAQSGVFLTGLVDDSMLLENPEKFLSKQEELKRLPASNLWLNNLSAFLYILSVYAPVATAGDYANSIKPGSEGLSGLIVGIASFSAIISAFFFSYLSNANKFKSSLIIASTVCLVGNLVYALAASFNSLTMVLVGRCILGLGGARAINRRYNSEWTENPLEMTRWNANFVTATALGMSLGPAYTYGINLVLSAFLKSSKDSVKIPDALGLFFDKGTNASWMLVLIWTIFIGLLIFFFKEPKQPPPRLEVIPHDRVGLGGRFKKLMKSIRIFYVEVASYGPLMFCLAMYVAIKCIADILLQSVAPLIHKCFTKNDMPINRKDSEMIAVFFIIFLGVFMLPMNWFVMRLKQQGGKENREQLVIWHAFVLFGCVLALMLVGWGSEPTTSFHFYSYIVSCVIIFSGTNAVEAVVYPILKGLTPSTLNEGVFNGALLSTVAGLLGRAFGGSFVTLSDNTKESGIVLVWKLYFPSAICTGVFLYASYAFRNKLKLPSMLDYGSDTEESKDDV